MGHVIATTNMKGGVGKTTLTVNIATALAKYHNKRVLVVDLDPQISATLSLMSPSDFARLRRDRHTLKFLLQQEIAGTPGNVQVHDVIQPYGGSVKGLDILPGDIDLYNDFLVSEVLYRKAIRNPERNFEKVWGAFELSLMKAVLEPVMNRYDFILLDCAPSYNLVTRSSLLISDYYLIPAKAEPLSYIGMQLLERQIRKLAETHQIDRQQQTRLLGIVFGMSRNLFAGRHYQRVMDRIRKEFGANQIFKTSVPMDVSVAKAVDSFRPVVISDPTSAGARAFCQITKELLDRLTPQTAKLAKGSKGSVNLSKLE